MRTIIAGSRGILRITEVVKAVHEARHSIVPSVVISGTAGGVDKLGEAWAMAEGLPIERYPADWNQHGSRAGLIRNVEMAKNAEALIAVWDGWSKGTSHMIETARKYKLQVYIHLADGVPTCRE